MGMYIVVDVKLRWEIRLLSIPLWRPVSFFMFRRSSSDKLPFLYPFIMTQVQMDDLSTLDLSLSYNTEYTKLTAVYYRW